MVSASLEPQNAKPAAPSAGVELELLADYSYVITSGARGRSAHSISRERGVLIGSLSSN